MKLYDEAKRWGSLLANPGYDARQSVGTRMSGDVLVLGSAPVPELPAQWPETSGLVCVNASQSATAILGLGDPDVVVLRRSIFWDRPMDNEARTMLAGKAAGAVVFLGADESEVHLAGRLSALGYGFGAIVNLQRWQRDRLLVRTTGGFLPMLRIRNGISSGLLAVGLAFELGADRVTMAGFSFTQDGHAYSTDMLKRKHVEADHEAVRLMRSNGLALFASSAKFGEEAGLPVWHRGT